MRRLSLQCKQHKRDVSTICRAAPLFVRRIEADGSPIECMHAMRSNFVVPVASGDHYHFKYVANVVPNSDLCGIIGLVTLRRMRALMDLEEKTVTFRVRALESTDSPPLILVTKCEIAKFGHMVLPCADFEEADALQRTRYPHGAQDPHLRHVAVDRCGMLNGCPFVGGSNLCNLRFPARSFR